MNALTNPQGYRDVYPAFAITPLPSIIGQCWVNQRGHITLLCNEILPVRKD